MANRFTPTALLWPSAIALALALLSCTRYDSDTAAEDIFAERETIPDSWQTPRHDQLDPDAEDKSGAPEGDNDQSQQRSHGEDGVAQDRLQKALETQDVDLPGHADETSSATSTAPESSGVAVVSELDNDPAESSDGQSLTGRSTAEHLPMVQDELLAWLYQLGNDEILVLVEQGLMRNFALAQSWHRLEGLRHLARIETASLYPQLSLHLGTQRGRANSAAAVGNNVNASVNLQWEIDWLGRMANERRAAVLRYQSAWQTHRFNQLRLVADIARAWYSLEESQRLHQTENIGLKNLQENLDIIEQGYLDGISGSLDVLLARNDLAQQKVLVRAQAEAILARSRALQLLLGRYPDGQLRCSTASLSSESVQELSVPTGIPSDLLRRRPDLNSAWYEVLAADLELAAASKDRFPRLSLTASYGGSSTSLSQLVDSGFNIWSLGVSLIQTIFDGGRKRAVSRQRRSELARVEQSWLQRTYNAFLEVEQLLSEYISQQARLKLHKISLESSEQAYSLALEQYASGTINYSTVLQAQRRVLQSRTRRVATEAILRRNRIDMFEALGGGWDSPDAAALSISSPKSATVDSINAPTTSHQ